MSVSARLALPFLVPGQAQKDLFHNEALQLLDIIVQPVVESGVRNDPPEQRALGACYVVGSAPTGDWAVHPDSVACWTEGGWRFCTAFEGLSVTMKGTGEQARFSAGQWQFGVLDVSSVRVNGSQVLSSQCPAIADPTGGAVIDNEARSTLSLVLSALRNHGLIAES